jgi:hypothetical protein
MVTRVAARSCRFLPAGMSDGFRQRGLFRVSGQLALMLAATGLRIIHPADGL